MNPSIVYLAVLIVQFSEGVVQLPTNINGDQIVLESRDGECSSDPFLSSDPYFSSESHEGKVFLFPWKESERKGDWFQNLGFCNKYCAEMVTINSDAENNYFHWFMRNTIGMPNPGAWLGAQIINATSPTRWMTREKAIYSNPAPGEYNEKGVSCLHVGWDSGNNKWWNYHCTTKNMMIACQRKSVRYVKSIIDPPDS